MRKLLAAVFAAALLTVLPAAPSLADGQNCHTYANDAGGKKFSVCVAVATSNNKDIAWARTVLDQVGAADLPYAFSVGDVILWSQTANGGNLCQGRYPGCGGAGNTGPILRTNVLPNSLPLTLATAHYDNNEHQCTSWAEAHNGRIYWTQSQYNNGVYDQFHNYDGTNGSQNSLNVYFNPPGECVQ